MKRLKKHLTKINKYETESIIKRMRIGCLLDCL